MKIKHHIIICHVFLNKNLSFENISQVDAEDIKSEKTYDGEILKLDLTKSKIVMLTADIKEGKTKGLIFDLTLFDEATNIADLLRLAGQIREKVGNIILEESNLDTRLSGRSHLSGRPVIL